MKIILAILSLYFLGLFSYATYALDSWMGLLAYFWEYCLLAFIISCLYVISWKPQLKKYSYATGVLVFSLLLLIPFYSKPSERILRSVLLKVNNGHTVQDIQNIVKHEYEESPYVMPQMFIGKTKVSISLMSQEPGNCTSVMFKLKDGKVIESCFWAD